MFDDISFELGELSFDGFKFHKSDNYTVEYFEKLYEDGTYYSQSKYLDGMLDQFIDSIHVKLSYCYLFITLALVLASVGIFSFFQTFMISSAVIIALSLISWFIGWLFLKSAKKEKLGMSMNESLIELIFEARRKKMQAEEEKGNE